MLLFFDLDEMLRTFNCGIGMVLVVDPANKDTVLKELSAANESAFVIGMGISSSTRLFHHGECSYIYFFHICFHRNINKSDKGCRRIVKYFGGMVEWLF